MDAGVSEETVYKAFGNKIALVRAIRDQALAGAGPVHAERRSDRMQASRERPASDHSRMGCPDDGGGAEGGARAAAGA